MFTITGTIAGKEVDLKIKVSPVEATKFYIGVARECANRKDEIAMALVGLIGAVEKASK